MIAVKQIKVVLFQLLFIKFVSILSHSPQTAQFPPRSLHGYSSMDSGALQIFNGKADNYGGVVVNLMEMEPMNAEDFDAKLDISLKAWKDQGKKGIWIKLSNDLSSIVNTAIKRGFTYHHAETDYVMLTCWIGESPSTIPANASHRIGIGAFVLNKNREVLVVQETGGNFKGT